MDKNYLFFDLDGTLTNPFEGITNSIIYALKKFGVEVEDKRTLTPFIGPPLVESFQKFYGFSPDNSRRAVEYYRKYFAEKGLYENKVYDGIIPALAALKAKGRTICLATSKPEIFAVKILEHFDLTRYFNHIAGATLDEARSQKAQVLAYAIQKSGLKDKSQAVMIGDRKHDILGAKANGISSVGVLYGFGDEDELKKAGADKLIETPRQLLTL
ncbi:MAG: HAD family hydrolase [Clostridia bacterium]|nr:HAD family hydrolase [Clostridia bacterium]